MFPICLDSTRFKIEFDSFICVYNQNFFPFYPLIDEASSYSHNPFPGLFKAMTLPDLNYSQGSNWWNENGNSMINTISAIDNINQQYQKMGFITNAPKGADIRVQNILNYQKNLDTSGNLVSVAIHSGHNNVNIMNTEMLLKMLNQMFDLAKSGKPMLYDSTIFAPKNHRLIKDYSLRLN